jgi:hypothetical protein
MRRELNTNHIVVKCTRPGWEARRDSDGFLVTSDKLRNVVIVAYQKMKKGS